MRKKILKATILGGMICLMASCLQNDIRYEINTDAVHSNSFIEFDNYVSNLTRASRTVGNKSFMVGDTMGVWGTQTTDDNVDLIFNNKDVRYSVDSIWTYTNKKIWNQTSTYMFYGVFPYSKTLYTMSNDSNRFISIAQYTVPDDQDDQMDIMVSERRHIQPFYTVDMVFHHLLSNINVFVKIGDPDTTSIRSITLKSLKFNNVMSTGKYTQTGWDNDVPVGKWTDIKDYMNIAPVNDIAIPLTDTAVLSDYMMMPQRLFSLEARPKDVTMDVEFKIFYTDGGTTTLTRNGIRLTGITGNSATSTKAIAYWEPGYRYNYILAFNPQHQTRIWDADGDGSLQIDSTTGNTLHNDDDTPFPGIMRYSPDDPDHIRVFEDKSGDGVPDTWVTYDIAWEDIDGDDKLEGGIDRDGDGHIDNVDGDFVSQHHEGNPDKDPTDGNPNNPGGKDVILVHTDTNHDGKVDDNDEWLQLQKDTTTGIIIPQRETGNAAIEFSAGVSQWDQTYSVNHSIQN